MRLIKVLVAGLMVFGGRADAATAIGSCLTNVVCATMWDGPIGANRYEVSYCSSAMVCVVPPPRFELQKFASIDGVNWHKNLVAGAGTIVTFAVCVYNGASVAVDGVTLMDKLPSNMRLSTVAPTVPQGLNAGENYYTGAGSPNWWFAWDTDGWGAAMVGAPVPPPAGQGGDVYMRWTFEFIEAQESACVTYDAEVL